MAPVLGRVETATVGYPGRHHYHHDSRQSGQLYQEVLPGQHLYMISNGNEIIAQTYLVSELGSGNISYGLNS